VNTVALENKGLSKRRGDNSASNKRQKKAAAHSKAEPSAFDCIDFDAALDRSLEELREGKLYEVDMKNPEESIQRILRAVQ
jgi:hypothetical protein